MRSFTVFIASVLIVSTSPAQLQDALRIGSKAPDFTLPGGTKDTILSSGYHLADWTAKGPVVLAFYPADWSGGCTKEMCLMRDRFTDLGKLGVTVFGISGDYVFAHHEWAKQLGLPFALLSDHNHAVAKLYASYAESRGFNLRTVYLIDSHGMVAYIDPAYSTASDASFEKLRDAIGSMR